MKLRKGHIAWFLLVVAAALAVVALLRPSAVPVQTSMVDRGPLRVTVDEEGETRVRDRFVLSAPVTGRLERLIVEVGDRVEAGEVVGFLHPVPLDPRSRTEAENRALAAEAARLAAEAASAQAETRLGESRRSLERLERVSAENPGAIAEQRLDEARAATESAGLELVRASRAAQAAGHEAAIARAALMDSGGTGGGPTTPLRAPVSGRVLRRYEEYERVIPAGSPVLEIGDPSRLEVVVDVLSDDADRLRKGAKASLVHGSAGDTISGWIARIEPSGFTKVSPLGVEEQRVNVIVGFDGGGAGLGDRYRVSASLTAWEASDVVRVPVSALFRSGAGWAVFVVEKGRAAVRPVEIAERGRREAEVLSGVAPGEPVVLYPPESLRDGARVAVQLDTAAQ